MVKDTNKKTLILLDSLPERYQLKIREKISALKSEHMNSLQNTDAGYEQLVDAAVVMTAEHLRINAGYITNELEEYIIKNYPRYTTYYVENHSLGRHRIIGYAKLCALSEFVHARFKRIQNIARSEREAKRYKRSLVANLAEAIELMPREFFSIKMPTGRRLIDWLYQLEERQGEDINYIKPKRSNNKNRNKLTDEQKRVIQALYADPIAISIADIYRKLLEIGKKNRWWLKDGEYTPPTYQTVYMYLQSVKNSLKIERHGLVYHKNTMVPEVQRSYPTRKNAIWGIDGTAQNEYVRHNGKVRQYAHIVSVYDYASFRLLDVQVTLGANERAEVLIRCLKNAIKECGYKPLYLQLDRGPGYNGVKQWCDAHDIRVLPTQVGLARAKVVELLIGLKNRLIDKYSGAWSGSNRTAQADGSQPGEKYLEAAKRRARDFAIASERLRTEVMEQWNHYVIESREGKPCGKTPTELWNELESETAKLSYADLAEYGTTHHVQLTTKGVTVSSRGVEYTYFPPVETEEQRSKAAKIFEQIPLQSGKLSRVRVQVLDYGKPAVVYKDNTFLGIWPLKERISMMPGDSKLNNYLLLQKEIAKNALKKVSELREELNSNPTLNALKSQAMTGRKRIAPLLDKSELFLYEMAEKSDETDAILLDQMQTELQYEEREYVHPVTGEIKKVRIPIQNKHDL
ncbi:hypothetical protein JCM31826_01510 [Thermaurantimonas aggregans]|uniref:Integrase catalytic domain-containing protein n=2 Tax=Thermaurantimonas aggregans TaxID=2173829 RepID=A0A401XI23_9FLAO|nr:hypothetical protein JCM31826_01510 [Thermaurantimonas aggregans]